MLIDDKFYSLNPRDVEKEDFFKNLPILFQQGFLIFVNPGSYLKQLLEPFFVQNTSLLKELRKYQIDESDTIIIIQYSQNMKKLLSESNSYAFEYFFFLLDNEYVISWVEAGEYTTIHLSLDFIDDKTMRVFCESLYINNYCTQIFSYETISKENKSPSRGSRGER